MPLPFMAGAQGVPGQERQEGRAPLAFLRDPSLGCGEWGLVVSLVLTWSHPLSPRTVSS